MLCLANKNKIYFVKVVDLLMHIQPWCLSGLLSQSKFKQDCSEGPRFKSHLRIYMVGCRGVLQLGGLFRGYPKEVPIRLRLVRNLFTSQSAVLNHTQGLGQLTSPAHCLSLGPPSHIWTNYNLYPLLTLLLCALFCGPLLLIIMHPGKDLATPW